MVQQDHGMVNFQSHRHSSSNLLSPNGHQSGRYLSSRKPSSTSLASSGSFSTGHPLSVLPFDCQRGKPVPYGTSVSVERRLVDGQDYVVANFALPSTFAKSISLALFAPDQPSDPPFTIIPLDPLINKTGNVWHISLFQLYVPNLGTGLFDLTKLHYAYQVNGGVGFIGDPFAKGMATGSVWGERADKEYFKKDKGAVRRCMVAPSMDVSAFDWDGDAPLRIPSEDVIIYEMHVRGFTNHKSSNTLDRKGTFLGVIEKMAHLRELGVNCVELLPVYEFNEMEYERENPKTKKKLCNYWGYSTEFFMAPMARYATKNGSAVVQFKEMVRELHRNGIEVVLDVVYNHTAEMGKGGPTISFRVVDDFWYIKSPRGEYMNFSGCGNTFNCNHPFVREFIVESLRYWVTEMHVDGFRFDLASILCRDQTGNPLPVPPVIELICSDPVLSQVKLFAEPWDAAGLYQVGTFPHFGRWAEWNGKYRDVVRRFMKGTNGHAGAFATRLCGSQDLYGNGRRPYHSVNFLACHDGFTLYDLVSYNAKRNFENGENNQDGCNDNDSWNCGVEGETDRADVNWLRVRQMKNMHLVLILSHGCPMMQMGDEYAHTKLGNNNTWCQDNELNWFLWDKLEANRGLFRFFCMANRLRLQHKILRRQNFLSDKDIEWHGARPYCPDWSESSKFVAFLLKDHELERHIFAAFNCQFASVNMEVPKPPKDKVWVRLVNTGKTSPDDFVTETKAHPLNNPWFNVSGYSAIVLKALSKDVVMRV